MKVIVSRKICPVHVSAVGSFTLKSRWPVAVCPMSHVPHPSSGKDPRPQNEQHPLDFPPSFNSSTDLLLNACLGDEGVW